MKRVSCVHKAAIATLALTVLAARPAPRYGSGSADNANSG